MHDDEQHFVMRGCAGAFALAHLLRQQRFQPQIVGIVQRRRGSGWVVMVDTPNGGHISETSLCRGNCSTTQKTPLIFRDYCRGRRSRLSLHLRQVQPLHHVMAGKCVPSRSDRLPDLSQSGQIFLLSVMNQLSRVMVLRRAAGPPRPQRFLQSPAGSARRSLAFEFLVSIHPTGLRQTIRPSAAMPFA